jgi:hypothetical protein
MRRRARHRPNAFMAQFGSHVPMTPHNPTPMENQAAFLSARGPDVAQDKDTPGAS